MRLSTDEYQVIQLGITDRNQGASGLGKLLCSPRERENVVVRDDLQSVQWLVNSVGCRRGQEYEVRVNLGFWPCKAQSVICLPLAETMSLSVTERSHMWQ